MTSGGVDSVDVGMETRMPDEHLLDIYMAAYEKWRTLNSETDCWSDPDKRLPMLHARMSCQDAKLAYIYRGGNGNANRRAGA